MDGLVRRGRAAGNRHNGNLGRRRGIIGRIHADGIDRRDQNAFNATRDEILHAVDLLELVLVRRNRRHIPAELLGARADAAQHGDVEGIVILRERYADGDLLLRAGGERQREQCCECGKRGERDKTEPGHANTSCLVMRT